MKVSLNWIKKYIDIDDIAPSELADRLTFAGVEVEAVEKLSTATKLVIGKVVECVPHPDSDHLSLTKVNTGEKHGVLQIVCGALNVKAGQKVIVALDGAMLPGGKISKGLIRGVESQGMICSMLELGVDAKFLTADQIAGIAGHSIQKKFIPGPHGVRGRNSDNRLLQKVLDWSPEISLDEGLKKTYDWIESQGRAVPVLTKRGKSVSRIHA